MWLTGYQLEDLIETDIPRTMGMWLGGALPSGNSANFTSGFSHRTVSGNLGNYGWSFHFLLNRDIYKSLQFQAKSWFEMLNKDICRRFVHYLSMFLSLFHGPMLSISDRRRTLYSNMRSRDFLGGTRPLRRRDRFGCCHAHSNLQHQIDLTKFWNIKLIFYDLSTVMIGKSIISPSIS